MGSYEIESFADWRRFTSGKKGFQPKAVNATVLSSWKRCLDYGIDPYASGFSSVSRQELDRRRVRKADLRKIATPYINRLYEIIKGSGSLIILADEEGVIIDVASDEKSHSIRNFPEAGTIQSEAVNGTNGIGTSLACRAPVKIRGAAHWLMDNHSWTCSGAPIFFKDEIVGCLNLSTPSSQDNSLSMGLVVSSVTAIERELELTQSLKAVQRLTKQQNAILALMRNGIILIDKDGRVIQANPKAHAILEEERDWVGIPVSDVLKSNFDFDRLLMNGASLNAHEISVKVRNKYAHVHISTARVIDEDSTVAMVIMIQESKSVVKMVNKIAGSTARYCFEDILGESDVLKENIHIAELATHNDSAVLIMGESGTGKELIAQSIHNGSDRRDKPFIAVNCGALSRELIQSELFGYEGGAYTGAKTDGNPGKFELADGGTIFLDEIGELPLESQVNLLRVLQTGEINRVGSKHTKSIDVRLITSTNKDLYRAVAEKTFREDLFYRINVFSIMMPPLRERRGDIRILVNTFLDRFLVSARKAPMTITKEAYRLLENYDWPGNIRQLENVIERAIAVCETDSITPDDLPTEIGSLSIVDAEETGDQRYSREERRYLSLEEVERGHLTVLLEHTSGNLRKVAQQMDVARSTVYRKIRRYSLNPDDYRVRSRL